MSDQCKNCKFVGDLQQCERTECFMHENWYVRTIRDRVRVLEEKKKFAGMLVIDEGKLNPVWTPSTFARQDGEYDLFIIGKVSS